MSLLYIRVMLPCWLLLCVVYRCYTWVGLLVASPPLDTCTTLSYTIKASHRAILNWLQKLSCYQLVTDVPLWIAHANLQEI